MRMKSKIKYRWFNIYNLIYYAIGTDIIGPLNVEKFFINELLTIMSKLQKFQFEWKANEFQHFMIFLAINDLKWEEKYILMLIMFWIICKILSVICSFILIHNLLHFSFECIKMFMVGESLTIKMREL